MNLSFIFISCGLACVGAGWIMSLAEGRKISAVWLYLLGIGFIFTAPFFAYAHWEKAKRPLSVALAGAVLLAIGILIAPAK
jgi:hypothetical protein